MKRLLLALTFVLAGCSSAPSTTDGGSPDDAGRSDSGVTETDAGTTDSGIVDAGASDSGVGSDAGTTWWKPAPGTSWQWQLSGTLDTSFDVAMYDIDLFDHTAQEIASLHTQGRKVICYFDTAYEPNRPDSTTLYPYRGNAVQGWPGQYWLDTRAQVVRDTMIARVQLASTKGCDGVEPDDVDAISNNPGFPITAQQQIDFIRLITNAAHARGMSVALKNDLDQIPDLLNDVDFALNEECFQYSECNLLDPFIAAGKAVFNVEYTSGSLDTKAASVCPQANAKNFDTLIKHLDLDAPRKACR